VSYYHKDDECYREKFEDLFGHLFVNSSVQEGDIDENSSDEYIKRLIQDDYLSNASVCVVLVGPKTYCRKHVDWEISAALNKKVGGYSGLLGLCLPEHPDFGRDKYNADIVPLRLVDNMKSGYAKFFDWTTDESTIKKRIEEAFQNRINKADKIENWRTQYNNDKCE